MHETLPEAVGYVFSGSREASDPLQNRKDPELSHAEKNVQLSDDVAAEASFKTCLEINAGYMPAIDALKKIYEGRED